MEENLQLRNKLVTQQNENEAVAKVCPNSKHVYDTVRVSWIA